jgi:hypothetical protein
MPAREQGSPRTLLWFVGLAFVLAGSFVCLSNNGFFEQYKHLVGQKLDQMQGLILVCVGVMFASISTKLSSLPCHEGRQTPSTHEKRK